MPIIYSVVARGTTVLAEYSTASGNFTSIVARILGKIDASSSGRQAYSYDNMRWLVMLSHLAARARRLAVPLLADVPLLHSHMFNYMTDNGITYLCMTDEQFPRRTAFDFLASVRDNFSRMFGNRAKTAVAYMMNDEFSPVLRREMSAKSGGGGGGGDDKLSKVRKDVDDVKGVMVQNISKVLDRQEKIEVLVDKTESLNQNAFKFKKSSTTLKRAMWWKNAKMMAIMGCCAVLFIYVIAAAICGSATFQCSSK